MRRALLASGVLPLLVFACGQAPSPTRAPAVSCPPATSADGTRAFPLRVALEGYSDDYGLQTVPAQPETPPADIFELVHYPAPLGDNAAYVSPVKVGAPGPAIVWISGGFDWGIGDAWTPSERSNDQTAAAFREAGITLMLPALRGSSGNPGRNELMLGEVADVRAAGRWLSNRPGVDPKRIYLGGHSTGGTLVLLVAETTEQFRAVFSFGPVGRISDYGTPFNEVKGRADDLRSPMLWIEDVRSPTWIIEGTESPNASFIPAFAKAAKNGPVTAVALAGAGHFSVLRPASEEIARAILKDTGATPAIALDTAVIRKGVVPER